MNLCFGTVECSTNAVHSQALPPLPERSWQQTRDDEWEAASDWWEVQFLVRQVGRGQQGGQEFVGQVWAANGSLGPGGIVKANGLEPPPCLSNGLASTKEVYTAHSMFSVLNVYLLLHVCVCIYLGEAQLSPRVRRWQMLNLWEASSYVRCRELEYWEHLALFVYPA